MSEIISTSARLSLNTLSLTDSELQRVGKLIYKRAGIVVNAQKREMILIVFPSRAHAGACHVQRLYRPA